MTAVGFGNQTFALLKIVFPLSIGAYTRASEIKRAIVVNFRPIAGWKLINGATGKRLISGAGGGACKWGWDIRAYKWVRGEGLISGAGGKGLDWDGGGAYKWGWGEGL